jgi:hypothetical protein
MFSFLVYGNKQQYSVFHIYGYMKNRCSLIQVHLQFTFAVKMCYIIILFTLRITMLMLLMATGIKLH